jgi:hypothetical protein
VDTDDGVILALGPRITRGHIPLPKIGIDVPLPKIGIDVLLNELHANAGLPDETAA